MKIIFNDGPPKVNETVSTAAVAVEYKKAGLSPIPIPYMMKGPTTKGWQNLEISDADIPKYFEGKKNIGIRLGAASNSLVDVDLDCEESQKIADYYLPQTTSFGYAGKVTHLLYQCEEILESIKYSDPLAKKYKLTNQNLKETIIELRSEPLQTMFPGSTHPNGHKLYFTNQCAVTRTDRKTLARLVALIAAASLLSRYWPRSQGSRQDLALALGGALKRAGWIEEEVKLFVMAVVATAGDEEVEMRVSGSISCFKKDADAPITGWTRYIELLGVDGQIIVSAVLKWLQIQKQGPNNENSGSSQNSSSSRSEDLGVDGPIPLIAELPEPMGFPIAALGQTLGNAAKAIQQGLQTPDSLVGSSLLAAASLAVQAHVDVQIDGRTYPTSLFCFTVAHSGERKSAVDKIVLEPHQQVEHSRFAKYAEDMAAHYFTKAAYELKKKHMESESKKKDKLQIEAALKELGPEPIPPKTPTFLVADPTAEGLVKHTLNGPSTLGIFSDEGGSLIGGYGMSKDNLLKTISILSKFWDATPIDRTRAESGSTKIYGRRLSLHLMVQPIVFQQLASNEIAQGQGILARGLLVCPTSTIGSRPYKVVDVSKDPALVKYNELIMKILNEKPPYKVIDGNKETSELDPYKLTLTIDAKVRWIEFHDAVETNLGNKKDFSEIRAFGSKAAEQALRIAGVLSYLESGRSTISDEVMNRAIDIATFYLSEAKRLHGSPVASQDNVKAQLVLDWIEKNSLEYIYIQKLCQLGPCSVRSAACLRPIIKVLVEHGWLIEVKNIGIDGKKRKKAWKVNHVTN